MGRKCSVFNCRSGYDGEKVTVYKFPTDEDERQQWISCIPNKFTKVTKYMGVCALHWPSDVRLVHKKQGRYPVPSIPPSIFQNIPDSCVSSHSSHAPRSTTKSLSSVRNPGYDELSLFRDNDRLKSDTFMDDFKVKFSTFGLLSSNGNAIVLQSINRTGCVHDFSCYFTAQNEANDFVISCELYFRLKRIHHPSLKSILKYWSELEEVLRYVRHYSDEDVKLDFLLQALQRYNSPKNSRLYSLEDLSLAFSWYAMSRALYIQLRTYLCLPSVTTLRRITQVAKNTEDAVLYSSIFRQLDERSRGCILIIDEIYIKSSLTYRGGTVFGYAEDCPDKLATTLLCVMVKCFFGSKSFLVKLIPCFALKADFQFTVINNVINTLEQCGAAVLGLLCDNNRLNQRFFGMFNTPDPTKPWIARSPSSCSRPLFLIYDPVHIIKNIRNSWLTEKSQTIKFTHNGNPMAACWSDLRLLFDFESKHLLKMSSLTKPAIQPNNIEKQKVSLTLHVFSSKTSSALKSVNITSDTASQTATFIDEVLTLWKVFNTKTPSQSIHQRDPDRAVVTLSDSVHGHRQIDILNKWTDFAKQLQPVSTPRQFSFTTDTARAIQWTCQSLISFSHYLLHADTPYKHKYVAFGFFQQDDIEHHFAHFRMSAGNVFYITVEDVLNTHAIDKTKLMIAAEQDFIDYSQAGHSCHLCEKPLTDAELLLLDDIPSKEVSSEEKISLLYIGGYICQKHKDSPHLQGDASLYPREVVTYTENLDQGGLLFPSEKLFQLLCYMYLFFLNTNEHSCRKRFLKFFVDFPNMFHVNIEMPKGSFLRIINIFFKRYCKRHEGDSSTANKKRKISKLSSSTFVVNL